MPGALLAVDAPSMLFRAFYALPDTIKGADGRPVNALLGTANLVLREVEQHVPSAPSCSAWAPTPPTTAWSSSTATTRSGPRCRTTLAPQFADVDATSSRRSAGPSRCSDNLEADDLLGSYATRRDARRAAARCVMTGDRDMFQCAGDSVQRALRAHRRQAGRRAGGRRRRCARRYGVAARAGARLHRAARRPLGRASRARKGIGEKTRGRAAPAARLARGGARRRRARDDDRRVRAALDPRRATSCARSRRSRRSRDVDVELPPDTPTDYAGAAAAAHERGMERLSQAT